MQPHSQRGFLLIAAVILIAVAALMAAVIVTLTAGSGQAGGQHVVSTSALYAAESGVEYGQRQLALNLDWYRDTSDPAIASGSCPPATVTRTIGGGTFTVCINFPATLLRRRVVASPGLGATNPVQVYTTDRFPTSGIIQVEDDISASGGAEFIQYTGISGNTFTGITRNVTVGGITGTAGVHDRSSVVYPVTTLVTALASSCTVPSSFQIVDNSKFLSVGTVVLDNGLANHEEIAYSGSSRAGGVMTLTGVRRCQNTTTSAAWAANAPVTPLLVGGASVDYEAEIMSVGVVDTGRREIRRAVQR